MSCPSGPWLLTRNSRYHQPLALWEVHPSELLPRWQLSPGCHLGKLCLVWCKVLVALCKGLWGAALAAGKRNGPGRLWVATGLQIWVSVLKALVIIPLAMVMDRCKMVYTRFCKWCANHARCLGSRGWLAAAEVEKKINLFPNRVLSLL